MKTIKFKNSVVDIFVNRFAIAVVFVERIAVFDVLTVEDITTITTCYPCPGIKPNPIALGTRFLKNSFNYIFVVIILQIYMINLN